MRKIKEEVQLLQDPGSYSHVGLVRQVIDKHMVLVRVSGCAFSLLTSALFVRLFSPFGMLTKLFDTFFFVCPLLFLFNFQIVGQGMHVVDVDENIDVIELKPSTRVALRRRSYTIHAILLKKIDPVFKLSKVQNNPECTYDMIGGLDEKIKEIKEVFFCTFLLSEFNSLLVWFL